MDGERPSVPAEATSAERAQRVAPWLPNCDYLTSAVGDFGCPELARPAPREPGQLGVHRSWDC
jgi:hypothetical protein